MAHGVANARNFFGLTGAGVKIGVLSDSVRFLEQSQASGELPADVVVLPGQSGVDPTAPFDDIGEGTAMLEIVHDLAPGAKLFFATAFSGVQSFADNIRALRAAGCDVIVDDVVYSDESPFQDGPIAIAVNEVTASGALYFSSAGNEGNVNDGTSSVWEGDFKKANGTYPRARRRRRAARLRRWRDVEPRGEHYRFHTRPVLVGSARRLSERLRPLHPQQRTHHRARRVDRHAGRRRRSIRGHLSWRLCGGAAS